MNYNKIDNFTTDQHTAVDLCLDRDTRIVAITGRAGTGKTMTLGEAVAQAKDAGLNVELSAPTGRAAARIREATGHRARTCHRMMGYGQPDPNDPDDESFPARGRHNPVPTDMIFVDESSMLSEELYRNLIDSLRKGACIRFFGDIEQLPPVNSDTSPFGRILKRFPSVTLTKNFRSTDGIIKAAESILAKRTPINNDKFTLIKYQSQMGLTVLSRFITEDMLDPKANQIIMPTRVGKLGTHVVNQYVQDKINPSNRTLELRNYDVEGEETSLVRIRPKDKILWTKNDYNLGLFNGMIGKVLDFDDLSGDMACEFEGRDYHIPSELQIYDTDGRKSISYDPRKYIDLAYAITTHKSQGSEFERVLIILYYSGVLTKQNFYTALTRGREHVTVLAGPGGLKAALRDDPIFKDA